MKHLSFSYYEKKKKSNDPYDPFAYNIYGFPLKLQVWTYEVIKSFVPTFAKKNELNDPLRSRLLVYHSTRKNTLIEIKSALETIGLTEMEESSMEKRLYSGVDFEQIEESTDEFFDGFTDGKICKDEFEHEDEDEDKDEELTPKPAIRKRKSEATLKEAVNLKRKLSYESSPLNANILSPPTPTSSPPTPSIGCKCVELKEELKEMKIELKEELKELETDLIKELKITIKETQQTHHDSMNKMIFSMSEQLLAKSNKRMGILLTKLDNMEEKMKKKKKSKVDKKTKETKVEEEEKKIKVDQKDENIEEMMGMQVDGVDDDVKVVVEVDSEDEKVDGEKVDGGKVDGEDEKVDVKVKDENSSEEVEKEEMDVKLTNLLQQVIENKKKTKVEDDDDDFKLYITPPKGKFGMRVMKLKKDDSYTNPSLSKLPKTNDPMKVNPLQKFEDELLDKVKEWLDDPKTKDVKKNVVTCEVGNDMFVRVLTRFTWLEDTVSLAINYSLM
ncbi:uncharacterized protein PF3D7_1120000-like [Impatiens glandulifera]|uniref:uncharacterized protein PF3D7_1120000-like n=1 Tax=Impatiens glandulifera TaxID=253017 RepID=UPI001FB110AF|nr:uncharacterized protein PF3D7_1120000-like [Impatiens glandulifera]